MKALPKFLFLLASFVALSCSSGTDADPAPEHSVVMSRMAFSPAIMTVSKGETVTWTNEDVIVHTATADNTSWNTSDVQGGSAKSITFTASGTYQYHCIYHQAMGMTGTIIVTDN